MLEKLNKERTGKVIIKLNWENEKPVTVKPLQYLEDDIPSYLVEVIESNGVYKTGDLIEVKENDIEYVNAVS